MISTESTIYPFPSKSIAEILCPSHDGEHLQVMLMGVCATDMRTKFINSDEDQVPPLAPHAGSFASPHLCSNPKAN